MVRYEPQEAKRLMILRAKLQYLGTDTNSNSDLMRLRSSNACSNFLLLNFTMRCTHSNAYWMIFSLPPLCRHLNISGKIPLS